MEADEYCGECGNGILFGYRTTCDDCCYPKKGTREDFSDAFGNWVSVGDKVEAHGVNEGLSGTVIKCETDNKAFTIKTDDGKTFYMNREWTKKV